MLMTSACIGASAGRLWMASHPTYFEPGTLGTSLGDRRPLEVFRALATSEPRADWERDLASALSAPPGARAPLVNEQLTELDLRLQRWSRIPRVCASVSTSFAFMLATLVLRRGLADTRELLPDVGELVVRGLVGEALGVAACGLVGAAFCVAAHAQAKRLVRDRLRAADRLVEHLERAALSDDRT